MNARTPDATDSPATLTTSTEAWRARHRRRSNNDKTIKIDRPPLPWSTARPRRAPHNEKERCGDRTQQPTFILWALASRESAQIRGEEQRVWQGRAGLFPPSIVRGDDDERRSVRGDHGDHDNQPIFGGWRATRERQSVRATIARPRGHRRRHDDDNNDDGHGESDRGHGGRQ